MAVRIKSPREAYLMRESGKRLAEVHERLAEILKPGISTLEITEYGEEQILKLGGIPNFKDYEGYPAAVCVSLNEEVVHGLPRKDRFLKEGDVVSLDTGMIFEGYHSDAARSYGIGKCAPEIKKLIEDTKESFFQGIKQAYPGKRLYDISAAIDDYLTPRGYGIVQDLTGHGIGRKLHEDPVIPNYRQKKRGLKLEAGMALAIEPMVNLGTWEVEFLEDGWTVKTKDRKPSAHYENTVLITAEGPEILTLQA
ncbi:MAG: type I methionyl aminopeptidase [Lachnospiraceae bacterium]|nr:type I methionyl aminopeptidase [Lachnospiraceae bacterium]